MAFEATNLRLFGLDLGRAGASLRLGVEGMLRWPIFAWFSPQERVHVLRPDGVAGVCRGTSLDFVEAGGSARATFRAAVLPPEIVLSNECRLPQLSERDIADALLLQLQTLSPLPITDIVWGWRIDAVHDDALDISVAFAARSHVDAYLERMGLHGANEGLEVWADVGGEAVLLRGFGEAARRDALKARRRKIVALSLLALTMLALLAVSHFAQVRSRVFDAQQQFVALQAQAGPYVDARDALVRANEQAGAIDTALDARVDLPWLIATLTEILPDSAWLARMDVEGRTVRILGQAADAAGLMESLRARTEFAQLRALSPISRGRDNLDSFSFEFVVLGEGLAQ
ncbi:MAG: hypothetical protein H2060_08020 [Azoarcus sp.]|nr:hypothetical protein [Azoarcus sp.]